MTRRVCSLICIAFLLCDAAIRPRALCAADRALGELAWKAEFGDQQNQAVYLVGFTPAALSRLETWSADAPDWARLMKVQVGGSPDSQRGAMLGTYTLYDGGIKFVPQFSFRVGATYCASIDGSLLRSLDSQLSQPAESLVFTVPEPSRAPATRVAAIYPSADVLPENLLRFYVHFSGPMRRGEVYDHVRLLDESGKRLELAFLEVAEELWSTDGRRITLLFDPGRIKQGLKPREDDGPVLMAGRRYTLEINATWPDAHGRTLVESVRKSFAVAGPDIEQPQPRHWKVVPPISGGRDALQLVFAEPLDEAMLQRVIAVRSITKEEIPGKIEVRDGEQCWCYVPDVPWQRGEYIIRIGTILEDVAGNSIRRPFESKIDDRDDDVLPDEYVDLPFVIE